MMYWICVMFSLIDAIGHISCIWTSLEAQTLQVKFQFLWDFLSNMSKHQSTLAFEPDHKAPQVLATEPLHTELQRFQSL